MFSLFKKSPKVFVLGIDGAPPQLVLDEWLDDLPNIKACLNHAYYGEMNSTIPPSTIVAWTSMLTGKDPSFSDVYSYTYKDAYNQRKLSNSSCVKADRIWKYLDKHNKKSILLNIPLTYAVEPLNGIMVSGFLTPEFNDQSVYPKEVKQEIAQKHNDYIFDVSVGLAGYKDLETDKMIATSYKMTKLQLDVTKDFIQNKPWDFFMTVLLGSDRMQHTMWRFHDKTHRKYPGPNKYENSLKEYYQYLDREIGIIKSLIPKDAYLIICSDHGFDKMDGRINLNDWFIKEGYLVMQEEPTEPQKLDFQKVDWSKTKCYAIGAYFGRIYFNRKAKDPKNGIVEENEIIALQDELIAKFQKFTNDKGKPIKIKSYKPQDVYKGPYKDNGPDLYIYFDNLRWGMNNDVGNVGLFSQRTTKGSDDAGHAPVGTIIIHHKSLTKTKMERCNITDVLPTIFAAMRIPHNLEGKNLLH